jgi:flagellar biosynthesis protein FlhG
MNATNHGQTPSERPGPRVWAIGGGKGGAGKSVIAANLASLLASDGRRVALVDADLGGANLHTLLGIPNPRASLSDFISKRIDSLGQAMTPTPVDNLWLVSGAKALVEIANLSYGQKGKLLRHVKKLEVDHVVLDLGAGSAFNVLDFFLAARKGTIVVVPEPTSIENSYHFLKAAFFRKLKRAEPRDRVRAAVSEVMQGNDRSSVRTPRELITKVYSIDPEAGEAMVAEANHFRPALIVNRADSPMHQRLGDDMVTACRDYFGVRLQFLGALPTDRIVARSVIDQRLAAKYFREIPFITSLRGVVEKLTYARRRTA